MMSDKSLDELRTIITQHEQRIAELESMMRELRMDLDKGVVFLDRLFKENDRLRAVLAKIGADQITIAEAQTLAKKALQKTVFIAAREYS